MDVLTRLLGVEEGLGEAALLLKNGETVAFPTETVYGLGANGLKAECVAKIFAAKGRPADNPLILHVTSPEEAWPLFAEVPDGAKRLAECFWPGPLTMIGPAASHIPANVRANLPTVAVRCPANESARALISACGFPLAAPSANSSGRPSPTTAQAVWEDMQGKIPLILDGGPCAVGVESTVVSLAGGKNVLLRPGAVTLEQLRSVLGQVDCDEGVLHAIPEDAKPSSPGMKHRHYAPAIPITLVQGERDKVVAAASKLYDECSDSPLILAVSGHMAQYGRRRVWSMGKDSTEVAEHLFSLFRDAEKQNVGLIIAEAVEETGVGLAVMNRLVRAADFHIVRV